MRLVLFLSSILFSTALAVGQGISLQNLRTEMLENPAGIDAVKPRLSWKILGKQRGIEQTAYQIIVASSAEFLASDIGDLWNSGKVSSSASVHVEYAGMPLKSRTKCFWKVKVWTNHGVSDWSKPSHWSIGLLHEAEWNGRWIGLDRAFEWDDESMHARLSARYFRKEFEAKKEIKEATAYIIGLGLYELYINGKRIGDQVLAPAPTDYIKNVKYNTFDVTAQMTKGKNTIGSVLGNGRYYTMRQHYKPYKIKNYGYPKMLLQLEIVYIDGSREIVKTDDSWKVTADGPIRSNNEYDGEEYDARKEMLGWNKAGFGDSAWLKAEYVQEPFGEYEAQMNEHMRVMETLKPVSIRQTAPGIYVLDLGQNISGWVKMRVKGSRGDKVTLRFAEILQEDKSIFTRNLRDAKSTDVYTLKGGGEEVWEPSFVYHGFQFVEITGYPGVPTVDDFEGRVVYDAIQTTGTFETSDKTINQIFKNASWGIKSNYKGIPVDCPQRNERQPWLGDRPVGCFGESFVFDNGRFYAKWLDDIMYAQRANGAIPDIAPAFWNYYSDNMTWPGTYIMVADMLYNQFGDSKSLKKHYPHMKKWLQYMQDQYMNEEYITTKDSYGDWCEPPATIEEGRGKSADQKKPSMLISTAYHYHYLQLMQKFARVTGNEGDIKDLESLASKIKEGFNRKFLNKEGTYYGDNTLTDNLLPLYFKMIPAEYTDKVFANIVHIVEVKNNGHLSTGLVGTQWIMRSLTDYGRPDLSYKLATNTTYPSWGYMIENGATAIWELWNGNTAAPNMNSYNHVMLLGDLLIWYYENLAGIKSGKEHPGFKQIEMKPAFPKGLDYVNASTQTNYGLVKSEWKMEKDKFSWKVTIPANTKAIVYIPAKSKKEIKEGGAKIGDIKSVKFLKMEGDRAVFEIGSGEYAFESVL